MEQKEIKKQRRKKYIRDASLAFLTGFGAVLLVDKLLGENN